MAQPSTASTDKDLNKARDTAFELAESENPYSHILPSPMDYLPAVGLFRIGQPIQGMLTLALMVFFLAVMVSNSFLFWGGLKSFFISLLLLVVSFKDLKDVFTVDILEFWIASIYCLVGFFGAWWVSVRLYQKKLSVGKQNQSQHEPFADCMA
jgi:hypothetical protein